MLSGVAFCPHPPLLVPEVAAAAAPELEDLRAACRAAITAVARPAGTLALIGAGPASVAHGSAAGGSFAGYGVALDVTLDGVALANQPELPLSLTVGAWLVSDADAASEQVVAFQLGPGWIGSAAQVQLHDLAGERDVALVVLGDGSACRSTAAPGYLDERAAAFDLRVAHALGAGDATLLRAAVIDPDGIARQLLCSSVPVWEQVAVLVEPEQQYQPQLRYDAAPYGVAYFAASWTRP